MGNDENWIIGLRAAGRGYEAAPPPGLWDELEAELCAAGVAAPAVSHGWLTGRGRGMWLAAASMLAVAMVVTYIICGDFGRSAVKPLVACVTGVPEITDIVSREDRPEAVTQAAGPLPAVAPATVDAPVPASEPQRETENYGYGEFSYYERVVVVEDGRKPADNGGTLVSASGNDVREHMPVAVETGRHGRGINAAVYGAVSPGKGDFGAPVTVGATVGIPVADRLTLETGVKYTGIPHGGSAGSYIGVPVRVSYDVYDNDRVRVYASAGGAVEKSLKNRDLQVSLGLGAGVEYSFDDDWGVFVEPGVDYYPDNGNAIPTVYKERRVSPEVRVGLRHTFQ